jgi:5-(carboxyamino)imidazole ribonucleotide synthase
VARAQDGAVRCFDVAENRHEHHILDVTVAPARVSPATAKAAVDLAVSVAKSLDLVGLLAVEMFVVDDGTPTGKILVNELAPRPHNSGHFTFDACITSQFEQQLRAVTNLPLGDVSLVRPAAMANLLGDVWSKGEPNWAAALAHADVKLHLYGKTDPRPGRKMGHIVAMADSADEAERKVRAAREALFAPYC